MYLYSNREHGVGVLKYELKEANLVSIRQGSLRAQMEFGECELVYDLPRLTGGGVIANLGHSGGGSAVLFGSGLCDRNIKGHVYSVDMFKLDSNLGYTEAVNDLKLLGLSQTVTPLKGTTNNWGRKHKDYGTKFSILFIDADHSYKGVKEDFLLWGPMVVGGGLVGFHDTNQEFSDRVLREDLIGSPFWKERKELHVNRIRVFEKIGE